jgi:hypothetical protein
MRKVRTSRDTSHLDGILIEPRNRSNRSARTLEPLRRTVGRLVLGGIVEAKILDRVPR